MADQQEARVAVYIDFDNIVISRYDQVFESGAFMKDRSQSRAGKNTTFETRLGEAVVDVGAVLDYASSFGSIVVSRAYADWSAVANANYRQQLVDRAVDLTQLFNVAGTKNGADIRLSVDVVEDLFRLTDVTHVVIVAGDSDYIALAQRCKRLGRYVVGIGVAGSTSKALQSACDEFAGYDDLPGIKPLPAPVAKEPAAAKAAPRRARKPAGETASDEAADPDPVEIAHPDPLVAAGQLLVRALGLIQSKSLEEWASPSELKNQMMRLDPSFTQKPLGFSSFTDFVESRPEVEIRPGSQSNERRIKLRG